MHDSTMYTIGTALRRASDNNLTVEVLVQGHWLSGDVAGVDGHGVVLCDVAGETAVVRLEAVSAVRLAGAMHDDQVIDVPHARPAPAPGATAR